MCHLHADPATIPSLRCRKALRHREWSQLSLTISDIGLRGLTLLCRGRSVTSFKFCPVTFPKPSPDLCHGLSRSWDGHKSCNRGAKGCSLSRKAQPSPPAPVEMWDQSKAALVQASERRAEAQSQIYATLLTWSGEFHYIKRTKNLKDRNTTHSYTLITGGLYTA